MGIAEPLLVALEKLETVVAPTQPTLPEHVAWVSIQRIWPEIYGALSPYKEGKYVIAWCEMSNRRHRDYLLGVDIDALEEATIYEEEVAHDEDELQELLLKRLPNLDGLITWLHSETKYP